MASESAQEEIPPFTRWAQRKDRIFVTVEVENAKVLKSEVREDGFLFECQNIEYSNRLYHLELTFFGKIDPSKTKMKTSEKEIFYVFYKVNDAFWPKLINGDKKFHFLKTDFEKWLDPEDSGEDDAERERNLDHLMEAMATASDFKKDGEY